MPTYVYRRADGSTFEVLQRISDDPLTADPETGEPVERVISGGAGLQFKGSGFYLTDYVRKSEAPKKEGGKQEEAPSSTAESGEDSGASRVTTSEPSSSTKSASEN